MALKFVNITRQEFLSDKLLHKFMSLENALDTLNHKHLWLANPTTWKDPFEKRFIEATYIDNNGKKRKFAWKDRVFCVCMTETSTSEAYWNTYSQQSIGIELKFRRELLLQELERFAQKYNVFIGKVEYMKTSEIKKDISKIPFNPPCQINIGSQECKARLLLLKRIAYKYEDEIRIIVVKDRKSAEKGIYLNYNYDNTDVIDSITLDPSIGPNVQKLLKDTFVQTYGFTPIKSSASSKKPKYRVQKSALYSEVKPVDIDI